MRLFSNRKRRFAHGPLPAERLPRTHREPSPCLRRLTSATQALAPSTGSSAPSSRSSPRREPQRFPPGSRRCRPPKRPSTTSRATASSSTQTSSGSLPYPATHGSGRPSTAIHMPSRSSLRTAARSARASPAMTGSPVASRRPPRCERWRSPPSSLATSEPWVTQRQHTRPRPPTWTSTMSPTRPASSNHRAAA